MKHVETKCETRYRAALIAHVATTSSGVAAQLLARHADYEATLAYIHVADEVKHMTAVRGIIQSALEYIRRKSQTKVPDSQKR